MARRAVTDPRGRTWALRALVAWEARGAGPNELPAQLRAVWEGRRVSPEARLYAETIVRLLATQLSALDRLIERHLHRWRLERLTTVDRNVLRLAAAELLYLDTPPREVLDAAARLADRYGTDDSARFVFGVLDAIRRHRGDGPRG